MAFVKKSIEKIVTDLSDIIPNTNALLASKLSSAITIGFDSSYANFHIYYKGSEFASIGGRPGYMTSLHTRLICFDNGIFLELMYFNSDNVKYYDIFTAIIKFSDSEFYVVSPYGDTKAVNTGNALFAFSTSNPDNYVSFVPLISVSHNFATGMVADGVYIVSGVDNSLWSYNGIVINGHTFYGAAGLCICAD